MIYASPPFTEYVVPSAPATLSHICFASDSTIWFSIDNAVRNVGRLDPTTGRFTMFPTGFPGDGFAGITCGSDGNIYIADTSANRLLQIAGTGASIGKVLNAFTPSTSALGGLAVASSGDIVFMDQAGKVGRITPQGVVAGPSAPPTGGTLPHGPHQGYDGNVWFGEMTVNPGRIGRVTPQGIIADFPLESGASQIFAANRGGQVDGMVWYTEENSNRIGRVSYDGASVLAYNTPGASTQPTALCPGPDGNVYYVGKFGNVLGRVQPAQSPTNSGVVQQAGAFGAPPQTAVLPGNVTPGNVLYAISASKQGILANTLPTGFQVIGSQMNNVNASILVGWRAASTSDLNTFTASSLNTGMELTVYEITGAAAGNPIDVTTVGSATTSNQISTGSCTPTSPYSLAIAQIALNSGNATFAEAWTGGLSFDGQINQHYEWASGGIAGTNPLSTHESWTGASDNAVAFLTVIKMAAPVIPAPVHVVELALPTPAAGADKLIAGPDGNLWGMENGVGKIFKYTPVQWFTYSGPFDAEVQAGEEYFVRIPLSQRGVSLAAPVAIASQLAAGDAGWFTFY